MKGLIKNSSIMTTLSLTGINLIQFNIAPDELKPEVLSHIFDIEPVNFPLEDNALSITHTIMRSH